MMMIVMMMRIFLDRERQQYDSKYCVSVCCYYDISNKLNKKGAGRDRTCD